MQISLLFMPRMKQKPKPDSRGSFSKMILYKNHLMSPLWLGKTKRYVDERRLKNHRFPLIKDKKINR